MNRNSMLAKDICTGPQADAMTTKLKDAPVLVLGDLLLDAYVYGRTERVSREAPCPSWWRPVSIMRRAGRPTQRRLWLLFRAARAAGFVGNDEHGNLLLQTLTRGGVNLIHAPLKGVETATKTRFLAGSSARRTNRF